MSNSVDHARFLPQFDVHVIEGINQRWTRWCRSLGRLMAINGVKEDSMKQNYLFFCAGDYVEDVYTKNANDMDTYEEIIEKLTLAFSQTVQQKDNEPQNIAQKHAEQDEVLARRMENNIEVFGSKGKGQEFAEISEEHKPRKLMQNVEIDHDHFSDVSRATTSLQTKDKGVYMAICVKPFKGNVRESYTHRKCTLEKRNKFRAETEGAFGSTGEKHVETYTFHKRGKSSPQTKSTRMEWRPPWIHACKRQSQSRSRGAH